MRRSSLESIRSSDAAVGGALLLHDIIIGVVSVVILYNCVYYRDT
jgi:hypothetical protein